MPEKKETAKPILAAALFCERILLEDQVHSLIRVVDVLKIQKPPIDIPKDPEGRGLATQFSCFLAFKSAGATGKRKLQITIEYPSGKKRIDLPESELNFLNEDGGVNVHATLPVPIEEEGLYWYDVKVDGELMTRMPMRVTHSNANEQDRRKKPRKKRKKA